MKFKVDVRKEEFNLTKEHPEKHIWEGEITFQQAEEVRVYILNWVAGLFCFKRKNWKSTLETPDIE